MQSGVITTTSLAAGVATLEVDDFGDDGDGNERDAQAHSELR